MCSLCSHSSQTLTHAWQCLKKTVHGILWHTQSKYFVIATRNEDVHRSRWQSSGRWCRVVTRRSLDLDKDLDEILNRLKQARIDQDKEVLGTRRGRRLSVVTVMKGVCMHTSIWAREKRIRGTLGRLGRPDVEKMVRWLTKISGGKRRKLSPCVQ